MPGYQEKLQDIVKGKKHRRDTACTVQKWRMFDGIVKRLDTAEERISELEDISIETSKNWKPKRARTRKTEQNMQGLWDNYKSGNMCLMGNQKEEKAPHSSTLTWKIPWMEEPGGLQSMGLLRVGHDWSTSITFHFHALEKAMATHSSVLALRILRMGEPGGLPSMGSHRVGHDWSDLAAAAAAERGKKGRINIRNSAWEFLQINVRHETRDLRSAENIK